MASEDHDFEEISSFVFRGKKPNGIQIRWCNWKIQTRSLAPLLDLFDKELGVGMDADVSENTPSKVI